MDLKPVTHYALTQKQRDILNLFYRFRFATYHHISQVLSIDKTTINKRLLLLTKLGYIGRTYERSYRILGKPATYYLLPKGIEALKALDRDKYSPRVLRNMLKDEKASDQFREQCLGMFDEYCQFVSMFGNKLLFLTKNQVAYKYDYFATFTPSAYMQLTEGDNERDYFVEYIPSNMPMYVITKRIRQYIEYADSGDWEAGTDSEFPAILIVCETKRLCGRLLRNAERIVGGVDARFYTACVNELDSWRSLSDSDNSPLVFDSM